MNSLPRELKIVTMKIAAMQGKGLSIADAYELDWLIWRKEQIEKQIKQESKECL